MKNTEVVKFLSDIADLLEMKGESTFRVRAYREAARRIENSQENMETLVNENRLTEIPGIGPSIAEKVTEYVKTGKSHYFEDLARNFPVGLAEMLQIPGVGAKRAQIFYEQLGITSIDELEEAARTHKLHDLPKFQEKTEQNVLEGIQRLRQRTGRLLLGLALPTADEVIAELRQHPAIERVEVSGSIRRMQETIGDIDILVASSNRKDAIEVFTKLPVAKTVLAKGPTKASILTRQDLQVDLRVVDPDQWGAALQYFTGSKEHNIQLRGIAESQGYKVNEYGVFRNETGDKVAGEDEAEIYEFLGMDCMPPEIRSANGEIEAAMAHKLPNLIELSDIKGDLHTHTNWSDGVHTIEKMAEAARAKGYSYLVISDHSVSMGFVHGLSTDRVKEQRDVIEGINKGYSDFRLLQGIEVNIRADGTLDYEDDVLARFDVVTASVHSGMKQPKEKITERMISAIRNPHVDVIGHPSGRLIGKRNPYDFDREAVFAAASETDTAMEIDSQPDRLDLKDSDARRASEMGVDFAIDSDAHSIKQLDFVRLGVGTARRGWVEKDRVLNAMPLEKLLERVTPKT